MLELTNPDLRVVVDSRRGADILSLVDRRTGVDVLFSTPWRARADEIRAGTRAPATLDPVGNWLEQYRGGWQLLCPNGGDPRSVHGATVGFHGEASVLAWQLERWSPSICELSTELFSVPVAIRRTIRLRGRRITVTDRLTNLSRVRLQFDYSQHPAFGGDFLTGDVRIDCGARRFTSDPERTNVLDPGSEHDWPFATTTDGQKLDLRVLPGPDQPREVFGWLSDFTEPWATITNRDLGLRLRMDWDGERLPFAWWWQELNATEGFPWFRRARAFAIEPASMQTSGPHRRSVLDLGPRGSIETWVRIGFEEGDE